MPRPPLENLDYVPLHPPVNGKPPVVIKLWGPASQLRWFERFEDQLKMTYREWAQYYCCSVEHKGGCCDSCKDDEEWQGYPNFDSACCCRSTKGDRNE